MMKIYLLILFPILVCLVDGSDSEAIFRFSDIDYQENEDLRRYGDHYMYKGDHVAGKRLVKPILFHNMQQENQRSLYRSSFQMPNSTYVPATFVTDIGAPLFLCFSRQLYFLLNDVKGFFIKEGIRKYIRLDKKYIIPVRICLPPHDNGNMIGIHLLNLWGYTIRNSTASFKKIPDIFPNESEEKNLRDEIELDFEREYEKMKAKSTKKEGLSKKAQAMSDQRDDVLKKAEPGIEQRDDVLKKAEPGIEQRDDVLKKAEPEMEQRDGVLENEDPTSEPRDDILENAKTEIKSRNDVLKGKNRDL